MKSFTFFSARRVLEGSLEPGLYLHGGNQLIFEDEKRSTTEVEGQKKTTSVGETLESPSPKSLQNLVVTNAGKNLMRPRETKTTQKGHKNDKNFSKQLFGTSQGHIQGTSQGHIH